MTQEEEKQKNAKNKFKFPFVFLSRLTRNAAFVLFLICIFLFLLYLIGNFQSFVDNTQLLILSCLSFSAIVLCIMTFLSFLQEAVFLFIKKKKAASIFSMLFFLFMLILGIFFNVFASVIRRLSLGL